MLMGATWTMATIAIILSVLRTYTNVAIIKHFCWDYYWAMLALVRSPPKKRGKKRKKKRIFEAWHDGKACTNRHH